MEKKGNEEPLSLNRKMVNIQSKLKAPKNLFNDYGKYHYRNAEGILEAVKPLLAEERVVLTLNDEPIAIADRYYIKATATVTDCDSENQIAVSAYAREENDKKNFDSAQLTGSCSSYARKYALNGLFLLDDNKDADTNEYAEESGKVAPKQKEVPKSVQDMIASPKQIQLIQGKMKEKGIDEAAVCKRYGVKNLFELKATQVTNVLSDIEATVPKKPEVKQGTVDTWKNVEELPFK